MSRDQMLDGLRRVATMSEEDLRDIEWVRGMPDTALLTLLEHGADAMREAARLRPKRRRQKAYGSRGGRPVTHLWAVETVARVCREHPERDLEWLVAECRRVESEALKPEKVRRRDLVRYIKTALRP